MCSKIFCVAVIATVFVCHVAALPSSSSTTRKDNSEKDLINMINSIDNEFSLPLFGGLRVDRVENGRAFGAAQPFETVDERAERYFQTHELNFSYSEDKEDDGVEDVNAAEVKGRSIEEPRRKKMKKMLVPILLAMKLKKAIIVKVLFTIIKFISLKSLAISFLALILAGATFFKDMLSKKKEQVTTAYIAGTPLNAEIVHSDWNRNGQASAADLAYNHYGLAQPF